MRAARLALANNKIEKNLLSQRTTPAHLPLSYATDDESDVRCSVFVCGAFSPGLTVITVLEKTVAAMPLRKASKAILASDIKSTYRKRV